MLKIAGAKVFKNGEFVEGDIFIEGDRIVATGDEAGEVIDAKGLLAIPGLVDVHSHGAVGYDFCDGTHESIDAITRYEASRGVTAWCGERGLSNIKYVFVGSVSTYLIRNLRCDVLVVKQD